MESQKIGYQFTPVPTTVWAGLKKLSLSEAEVRVLALIGDRTWNWNRSVVSLSHAEIARETLLSESASKRALQRLISRALVIQTSAPTFSQPGFYLVNATAFGVQGEGAQLTPPPTSAPSGPSSPQGARATRGEGAYAPRGEGAYAPPVTPPQRPSAKASARPLQTPLTDTSIQTHLNHLDLTPRAREPLPEDAAATLERLRKHNEQAGSARSP